MAKLKMKKIELIASLTDSKKIIELLQRRGVVELCTNTDEDLEQTNVTAVVAEFEKFRSSASQALDILDRYAPAKTSITDMFGGRSEVEKHDFGERASQLERILNTASAIIADYRQIGDAQAEIAQLRLKSEMLEPWRSLDVPLNFKGTAKTAAFIGSLSGQFTAEQIESEICAVINDGIMPTSDADDPLYGCSAEVISSSKSQTNIFVLCSREIVNETENALRKMSFVPVSETSPNTPEDIISENSKRVAELTAQTEQAEKNIAEKAEWREKLQFAVDFLEMRKDKYSALSKAGITETSFVLNGYIPEKRCEALEKEIEGKFAAYIEFTDPADEDDVPVMLENGRFSAPVEDITKMFAMPSKTDVDPTPVMAFFYYLFFGMMLSDAGYGLVMVIGTTIALSKFKLEDGMRKTMKMFRNCGISTVFWGAMFGSWFGDIVQVVAREFFGREIGSIALWFEPIDDPIKLLLFSFGLGIIHLFVGVGVAFWMTWSSGKKLDAIMDAVPIYLTIIGVAPIGASLFTEVSGDLKTAGTYVLIAGVVLMILTARRSSKNIFARFFGGVYALYNTATGWLGDILSYSRLLALGLATGSIAGVFNLIGTMPENKIVKLILLLIVFILGHTINLAINLLGAYVHTDRLQFVELFGKFYEGGGREFEPFTVNTKYIKFKEENQNE